MSSESFKELGVRNLLVGVFTFLVPFAWNSAMNTLFDAIAEHYDMQDSWPEVIARFTYAILLTILVVLVIRRLMHRTFATSRPSKTSKKVKRL